MTKRDAKISSNQVLCCILLGCFLITPARSKDRLHLFEVSNGDPTQSFVVALYDRRKVDMALKIASGATMDAVHVNGKIVKSRVQYNPKWSFHLSPDSITFFTFAPTVCGRGMSTTDVQSNLDLVGKPGSPLAVVYWCPLGSRVAAELTDQRQ